MRVWRTRETSLALIALLLPCSVLDLMAEAPREVDRVNLSIARGDHDLLATHYRAAESPSGVTILLLQGFPGGDTDDSSLAECLAAAGHDVLSFNYSGCFGSGGTHGISEAWKDIETVHAFLMDGAGGEAVPARKSSEIVLGGYSFGGGMAMAYAAEHPEIGRVFSIAGTDHGRFARDYLGDPGYAKTMDAVFDSYRYPEGPVRFEGRESIDELTAAPDRYDLLLKAGRLVDRDLLLVGGWDVPWVSFEAHILPFYRSLRSEGAERIALEALPCGHSFAPVMEQLCGVITGWLSASVAQERERGSR